MTVHNTRLTNHPSGTYAFPRSRKKLFKKAVDADDSRRRREETTIQIRKTKKDDRLNKRRQMGGGPSTFSAGGNSVMDAGSFGQPDMPKSGPHNLEVSLLWRRAARGFCCCVKLKLCRCNAL